MAGSGSARQPRKEGRRAFLGWVNAPVAGFWGLPLQAKLVVPLLLLVCMATALLGRYELASSDARVHSAYDQLARHKVAAVAAQLNRAPNDTSGLQRVLAQLVSSSPYVDGVFLYRQPPGGAAAQVAGYGGQPAGWTAQAPLAATGPRRDARSGWYEVLPTGAGAGSFVVVAMGGELAGDITGDLFTNLLVIALVEVAVLLVGFRLWTRLVVTRRVARLASIASRLAAGTFDVEVKEMRQNARGDEISKLALNMGRLVEASRVRSDRQAALDQLSEESAKGLGLAQIYASAARVLADGGTRYFAGVYEMFAPSGMLILRTAVNDPGLKRQLALLGPRQYHSQVLRTEEPIAGSAEAAGALGLRPGTSEFAAITIPGRQSPHGLLLVGSADGAPLKADRLEFLKSVSHMVATAVNALHDPLTSLPNRLLFDDRLAQALEEGQRRGQGVCLYYIDLDNFKEVNDGLGHQAGDLLLRHVADRLRKVLRASDLLARLGGDEFSLVQTISPLRGLEAGGAEVVEPSAEAVAVQTASRLLQALAPPFTVEGSQLYVSASIGIAIYPEHGTTPVLLSRNADRAMYEAKSEQKGAFRIFTQSMHSAAVRRLTIESGLRAALHSDGLQLHFQPQVDVARPHAIVGFEALLRWPDSGTPPIAPSTFVPVAEQTGLIVPIGLWALRQACIQAVEWQRRGYPPARMAVNVAAGQFARPDFVDSVRRVLDETGLDPALLELEVTEGSVMRDLEEVTLRLNELRALGVTIAVDDFGTGYSSLAYLNRLPFDALKVDRSFIRSMQESGEDHVLVGAIVQLGRNLNKTVIAEGIETVEQLHHLRGLGCDVGQGYLFARPISGEEASTLLSRQAEGRLLRAEA